MTSDSTVELTELSLSESDEDSVSGYAGLAKSVFVLQTLFNRVKGRYLDVKMSLNWLLSH